MKYKIKFMLASSAISLALIFSPLYLSTGACASSGGEMLEHEELYEKYKNAPAGSEEKEEYYKQYSAAYSAYIKNGGKPASKKRTGSEYTAGDSKHKHSGGVNIEEAEDGEELSSADLYAMYKNEKDQEKKKKLYDEYLAACKREKESRLSAEKNPGAGGKSDKNLSGKKAETVESAKARADRAYEKYKNAPAGSGEKEEYYQQYQREYKNYQAKLKEKRNGGDATVVSNGDALKKQNAPYFAATGGYIADTPSTPVPAVSGGGGGGGNIFKKLFRKAEQSTEKLIGAQTTAALELLYGVDKDPAMNARLNRVAERIAAVSDRRDIGYSFKILKMNEVNAFAVPGGAIYVTSEMMNFISSDSELAFILGHEMGHQVGRHSIKAFEKALLIDYFIRNSKAGVIKNNKQALEIANMFLSMQYSRENEFESDRYGFKYATMTGYNPYGSVAFFDKLKNKYEKDKTPAFLRLFQTHPSTHDRLIEAQNMAVSYSASNPQWKQYAPQAK
ncbi:MAG TPA: M48 family metalloprotease [Candidatus Wallbacteria bacterium]|nr:MAG: TPR repeat-containing protein YfgC precursor [bacterium ADurb.Bin243]HPG56558.1 M48 family metalloprotease [Candidatus Wallbacteria bacterium]